MSKRNLGEKKQGQPRDQKPKRNAFTNSPLPRERAKAKKKGRKRTGRIWEKEGFIRENGGRDAGTGGQQRKDTNIPYILSLIKGLLCLRQKD